MNMEEANALTFVGAIDALRAKEGDSVTILCDNPDFNGQPNCAIECSGEWTNWEPRRFAGDTVLSCLCAATAARREKEGESK